MPVRNQRERRINSGKTNRTHQFHGHTTITPIHSKLHKSSCNSLPITTTRSTTDVERSCYSSPSVEYTENGQRRKRPHTAKVRRKKKKQGFSSGGFSSVRRPASAIHRKTTKELEEEESQKIEDCYTQQKLRQIKTILRQRYKGKSSLRGVFLSWDINRDGMVDEFELKEILDGCGCPLTDTEAKNICGTFGREDNTIPYNGFVDLIFEREKATESSHQQVTEYLRQRLKQLGVTEEDLERDEAARRNRMLWKLDEVIPRLRERYRKKKSLASEFRLIDDDKDGYVSKIELRQLLSRQGYEVDPTEIDALFLRIDDSGDDKVEYGEFIDVVFPIKQIEPTFRRNQRLQEATYPPGCKVRKIVRKRSPPPTNVLQHIANNNDPNYFSRDHEVEEIYMENDMPNSFDSSGIQHVDETPKDGIPIIDDQLLQREEQRLSQQHAWDTNEPMLRQKFPVFDKSVRAARLREHIGKELRDKLQGNTMKGFHIFDRDGDGRILHSEFKFGLSNLGIGLTMRDAELLLSYMDKDNSGYVGYDEFCQLVACSKIGKLNSQSLKTIEDATIAKSMNKSASIVNIGLSNRSKSAKQIELAKKTKLNRFLFPKQDLEPEIEKPDQFKHLRKRAQQFKISKFCENEVSARTKYQPHIKSSTNIYGRYVTPSEMKFEKESQMYGALTGSAYRNQPNNKKRRSRERARIERKRRNEIHLRESSPDRFEEDMKATTRRLKTIIKQRLGYYENLQHRLEKDNARNKEMF